MDCSDLQRLSAYHDGELSDADAIAVRAHADACPRCGEALAEMRGVSASFDGLRGQTMSAIGMARAREVADRVAGGAGTMRLAAILTGVAASLLVVSSAWLFEGTSGEAGADRNRSVARTPAAAPEWERVAMTLDAASPSLDVPGNPRPNDRGPAFADAALADWMLRNLNP